MKLVVVPSSAYPTVEPASASRSGAGLVRRSIQAPNAMLNTMLPTALVVRIAPSKRGLKAA